MGKISSEPQQTETTATHFSHPHPLKLINFQPSLILSPSCSGCKLKPSGTIYSCTICNYFLHKKCFEMPKKITHPFHKEHPFTLLPEPAYAEGVYNCDACRETGNGFSYHCKPCGIDLHILCAAMPLSLTTAHHPHKLDLTFESPYDTKNFACDICKGNGSNHWLYRCSLCGFDAHLKCARGAPPVIGFQCQEPPPPQPAATCSRSAPVPQPQGIGGPHFMAAAGMSRPQGPGGPHFMSVTPPPMQQSFMAATPPPMPQSFMPHTMMNNAPTGVPAGGPAPPPFAVNRQNEMALQAIMQMIQNQNAMTQSILAGSAGGIGGGLAGAGGGFGGGYGGDNGMQQLMKMMSSLNVNSGFGSGGIPGLNGFGGGGGQDFLQALMSGGGGGGGGLDSLQSLLGGGGGLDFLGGGGLDFLSGAFGGF